MSVVERATLRESSQCTQRTARVLSNFIGSLRSPRFLFCFYSSTRTTFSAGTISTLRGTSTSPLSAGPVLRGSVGGSSPVFPKRLESQVPARRDPSHPDVSRPVCSWRRWRWRRDPSGTRAAGPRAATSAVHMAPLLAADMAAPRGRLGHIRAGAGHQRVPPHRAWAMAGPDTPLRYQKLFSRFIVL